VGARGNTRSATSNSCFVSLPAFLPTSARRPLNKLRKSRHAENCDWRGLCNSQFYLSADPEELLEKIKNLIG